MLLTHSAAFIGSCERARNASNTSEPRMIAKIIADVSAVCSRLSFNCVQLSAPCEKAIASIAITPTPAASVGVKMPP